jgi:outer membrane protein OmpA-like peptidoglycan-associated protein
MELDDQDRAMLDNIILYIKADPRVYAIEINGFTDTAGASRDNLENSRLRAFTVHEYFINNGIDDAMLETRYFGETQEYLIVRNERTAADRDRNRRVTLLLRRR